MGQVSLLVLGHELRAADGGRECSVQFNSIWRVHHGLLDCLEWHALEQRDPRVREANVAEESENCGHRANERACPPPTPP